jgi:membrane protein
VRTDRERTEPIAPSNGSGAKETVAFRREASLRRSVASLARAPFWLVRRTRGVFVRCARDDITATGSQFAYNAFLATVPFLFVIVSLVGLLPGSFSYEALLAEYGDGLQEDVRDLIDRSLRSATENTGRTAVFLLAGLIGSIWLAANVSGTLIGGIDRARAVPHRHYLHGKTVHIAFALAFSLFVVVTTVALVGGPGLIDEISRRITGEENAPALAQNLVILSAVGIFLIYALTIYTFGPNARSRGLWTELPGALIATAGWVMASRLFAEYIERFNSFDRIYGGLGFVVVYLVFLWLTGILVLIGAEINEELVEERRRRKMFGSS